MSVIEGPTTGYFVWRLSLKWRSAVDRALAPLGLTHAQYTVLGSLYGFSRSSARPSQRELADRSGLEPMFVSKLVRAMERAGILERAGNPTDPRAVQVTLTRRGEQVAGEAVARVGALHDELMAPLGGAGSPDHLRLLEALKTLLGELPAGQERRGEHAMSGRQPVNGQVIGQAERALAPLLDVILKDVGTSFETWVTLNLLATRGAVSPREGFLQDLGERLPVDPAELVGQVESAGLIREVSAATDGIRLELTSEGAAMHARIRDAIARTTATLYEGIDPDDLATTREVLEEVTRRAKAQAPAS